MDVLVLVWIVVGLHVAMLLTLLATARAAPPAPGLGHRVDPCLGPVTGLPPRALPTTEDVLQARLLGGALSREDYRTAMARLAAEDDAVAR